MFYHSYRNIYLAELGYTLYFVYGKIATSTSKKGKQKYGLRKIQF